jgi:hypothetical protein
MFIIYFSGFFILKVKVKHSMNQRINHSIHPSMTMLLMLGGGWNVENLNMEGSEHRKLF